MGFFSPGDELLVKGVSSGILGNVKTTLHTFVYCRKTEVVVPFSKRGRILKRVSGAGKPTRRDVHSLYRLLELRSTGRTDLT